MKKTIQWFTCFSMLLSMTSCDKSTTDVSIFLYHGEDVFIAQLSEHLSASIGKDYSSIIYDAKRSQIKQNDQLQEALEKGTKMVLMNPVDRLSSRAIIEKCKNYNVPVFFFNREPLLEDMQVYENCFYVGPDASIQGELQAAAASTLFGDYASLNEKYDLNKDNTIQAIVLKGEQGHQDAEKRTKSSINELKRLGYDVEVLSIEVANWNRQEAYTKMSALYPTLGTRIELIMANNDEMAIGAYQYLVTEQGYTKDNLIPIIGVDATNDGIKAVNDGYLIATVVNEYQRQSEVLCELIKYYMDDSLSMNDFPYTFTEEKFIYVESSLFNNN